MTETKTGEEVKSVFSKWIEDISKIGKVNDIDHLVVKAVLEESSANFPPKEKLASLGEYTNASKRSGLDIVWGENRVNEYKKWTLEYVKSYEEVTGKLLPKLKPSGSKNSGMIQFFGELTAFASGVMSFETFREYTEARALNGKMWEKDRKDERITIKVPTSVEPILLSSFPPGFPSKAWEKIQTLK